MITSRYLELKQRLKPRRQSIGDLIEWLHPHTAPDDERTDVPPGTMPLDFARACMRWLEPTSGTFRFVAAVRLAEATLAWALHQNGPDQPGYQRPLEEAIAALQAFEAGGATATEALLATERIPIADPIRLAEFHWLVALGSTRQLFGGIHHMMSAVWTLRRWAEHTGRDRDAVQNAFFRQWWRVVRCRVAVRNAERLELTTIDWRAALENVARHPHRFQKVQFFATGHGNAFAQSLLDSPHAAVREFGVTSLSGRLSRELRERLRKLAGSDRATGVRTAAATRLGIHRF